MRGIKAKRLRRKARALTPGSQAVVYRGRAHTRIYRDGGKEERYEVSEIRLDACTRKVYQQLKRRA